MALEQLLDDLAGVNPLETHARDSFASEWK
jgi:hypothetical protein